MGVDDLLGELLDLRQRAVAELGVGHLDTTRWWAVISSTNARHLHGAMVHALRCPRLALVLSHACIG
jgi:hypothetical protein